MKYLLVFLLMLTGCSLVRPSVDREVFVGRYRNCIMIEDINFICQVTIGTKRYCRDGADRWAVAIDCEVYDEVLRLSK